MRIVQILTTLSFGDAVSNDCLAIDKLLRDNGYDTRIIVENLDKRIPKGTASLIRGKIRLRDEDIVLYHLSTGTKLNKLIKDIPNRKFMIYHNVTPAHFFKDYNGATAKLCAQGREQAADLKDTFEAVMCDSDYNRQELAEMGYECKMTVRPILIPFEDYEKEIDHEVYEDLKSTGKKTVIFVGRIAPNKCQEDIIKLAYTYKKMYGDGARFVLVGSSTGTKNYLTRLKTYARILGLDLESDVVFTGQISFKGILAHYKAADAFVCMSEHEGFCVPLVEAMKFEVPILAYDSCAVPGTLNGSGVLLDKKDMTKAAFFLHEILEDENLRAKLIEAERTRLADFSYENVSRIFMEQIKDFIG